MPRHNRTARIRTLTREQLQAAVTAPNAPADLSIPQTDRQVLEHAVVEALRPLQAEIAELRLADVKAMTPAELNAYIRSK